MRKQDDEFIPPNDTLAVILRKAEEGQFIDHAGAEVQRCQAKLLAVASKRGARAVGTVTITLKIEMGKDGHADVTGDIKTKEPKMPRASTGIYVGEDGEILARPVERQMALAGIDGGASAPAARKVEAL